MPVDMSLAGTKAPPRKRTSPAAKTQAVTEAVEANSKAQVRHAGMMGIAQLAQGLCAVTGQYADAATIGKLFPPISVELATIADSNEVVAKPIDFLIEIGPYGGLIAAVLPFAMQIAANHKWVDASKLMSQGITPPEVLESQMKAEIFKAQAEAKKAQQEALMEAQKAEAEYRKILDEEN